MSKDKSRLQLKYENEIRQDLMKELGITNVMAAPTVTKIVVNSGLGEAKVDHGVIDEMVRDIALITGQKPVVTRSRKAISNFKIRENMDIGVKVTLRNDMMWHFLDRLISISLPRIRDFRGISDRAFDKKGNYSLGIKEHTVFPEVDATKVSKLRGLQIIINTSARNDNDALLLLKKLGMPFVKREKKNNQAE
ncbi:MAG: 50S ribosomal protein L5 [Candidatus Dojkabacteria bacterium]|uniref:Large ribosomal subunit protein uL5 n=1 Tax=Candidatus Dojkabacteria bacterium TaxID=2099670 RepID=A0A952DVM1_9BACT|nr:50S ribosomal protein L5 [Candidatus Dojkabacteria bacterium]WKZ27870.1 MAG: 50S ribosomal protein L5 [Candidatus Dojkabacteria bacterium]